MAELLDGFADEDKDKLIAFYQQRLLEMAEHENKLLGDYCAVRQELYELKGGVGGFLANDNQ
jgi:hypothetical protein